MMKKSIVILFLSLSTVFVTGQKIILGIVAGGSAGIVVVDGLIFHLDNRDPACYPGTGTTIYDLTANDLDGTLDNEAMAQGDNLRLNNSTDAIAFGHDAILEPASITISIWANVVDHSDRHIMCTKWRGWTVEVGANKDPYFKVYISGENDSVYSNTLIEWDEWHNYVGIFNNDNYTLQFYLDGEQTGSRVETGSINYNQGTFNIPFNNDPSRASGEIGPVMIYNRVLSPSEVKQNYNVYKLRFGY